MARLKQHYNDVVKPKLKDQFGYGNDMAVPKLDKIVINMGVGDAVGDSRKLQNAVEELALISGQKPVVTKARR